MTLINSVTGAYLIIGIYADDLLITEENTKEIEKVILMIKYWFRMKNLGEARNVLGMKILRKTQHLTLDQLEFAAKIAHEFYYEDIYILETSMEPTATV